MVEGPTDTTTVGLGLQLFHHPLPPLSSPFSWFQLFLKDGRDNSSCSWVLSSFFSSFSLILFLDFCPSFFISNNFCLHLYNFFPLASSTPACPCSKCTYCPLFPLLPSSLTPAVPHEDPFTRGKGEKKKCITTTPRQCIVFQHRKIFDRLFSSSLCF